MAKQQHSRKGGKTGHTTARPGASTARRAERPAIDEITARRRPVTADLDEAETRQGYGYPAAADQDDQDQEDQDQDEEGDGEWDEDDPDRPDADEGDEDEDQDEGEGDEGEEDEGEQAPAPARPSRPAGRTRRADVEWRDEVSAATYRAGVLFPLSTGGMMRLRPFSLLAAMQEEEAAMRHGRPGPGVMPNHLLAAAKKMLQLDGGRQAPANRADARRQGYRGATAAADEDRSVELIQWLVAQMCASFRVVLQPKRRYADDEVYIGEIWDADQTAIMEYAMKGQRALASFRGE